MTDLSKKQQVLIKDTWSCLEEDMEDIGIRVFLRIFTQNPGLKKIFPFRDCSDDALETHPVFRSHAYRYGYWLYFFIHLYNL